MVLDAAPADTRVIEVVAPSDAPTGTVPELESWLAEQRPLREPKTSGGLGVIYTSGTTGRLQGIVREPVGPERLRRMTEAVAGRMGSRF